MDQPILVQHRRFTVVFSKPILRHSHHAMGSNPHCDTQATIGKTNSIGPQGGRIKLPWTSLLVQHRRFTVLFSWQSAFSRKLCTIVCTMCVQIAMTTMTSQQEYMKKSWRTMITSTIWRQILTSIWCQWKNCINTEAETKIFLYHQ